MAAINDQEGRPVGRETQIATLIELGMTPDYAAFVVALQTGEITGDVVALDDDGQAMVEDAADER